MNSFGFNRAEISAIYRFWSKSKGKKIRQFKEFINVKTQTSRDELFTHRKNILPETANTNHSSKSRNAKAIRNWFCKKKREKNYFESNLEIHFMCVQ